MNHVPLQYLYPIWELTKPPKESLANTYFSVLYRVLLLPEEKRYQTPFPTPKKSGGYRTIYPAGEELRFVQWVLSQWLKKFPLGQDYCYLSGGGVLQAVKRHLGATSALVFDLKNAFEHVTANQIVHILQGYNPNVNGLVLDQIARLLTYQGLVRQGCCSSLYAYNLVIKPLDEQLCQLVQPYYLQALTRYSDNICLSSQASLDFDALEAIVKRLVAENGFEISWMERYQNRIVYLGTEIRGNRISLAEGKYSEFCDRLEEALASHLPKVYLPEIRGIYNWIHHICGEEIPEDLLHLLVRYFQKVRQIPPSLSNLLARRNTVGRLL